MARRLENRKTFVSHARSSGLAGDTRLREYSSAALLTSSGDAQLYVISTNAILRIFATVLDDPSWFQLLYSVDHRSFSQLGGAEKGKSTDFGSIWVPESQVLQHGAADALATAKTKGLKLSPKVENVLELVKTGELDLAVWFGPNGTVALRSLLVS